MSAKLSVARTVPDTEHLGLKILDLQTMFSELLVQMVEQDLDPAEGRFTIAYDDGLLGTRARVEFAELPERNA